MMLCCSFGNQRQRTHGHGHAKQQLQPERKKTDFNCRKSIKILPSVARISTAVIAEDADGESETAYKTLIAEAKSCVGHGGDEGAFKEEWDAQLLVDCGRDAEGHRVVMFCPAFLGPFVEDAEEMELAFKYILLRMDYIAMKEKYHFIYCYLGMDWSKPLLAAYIRQCHDILPRKYSKHLQSLYILNPSMVFKLTLWSTLSGSASKRVWDKVVYKDSLNDLLNELQPENEEAREQLRRYFPQMAQCNDAQLTGKDLKPVTFGVPLRQFCSSYGVGFSDRTTGRWYPRLPPIIIFLCEIMEREGADERFADMFSVPSDVIYPLIDLIDAGKPLPREVSHGALWCALKMYMDCLPSPLLSSGAIAELRKRGIGPSDHEKQHKFLIDTFHSNLCNDAAYLALYLASFLHTMCQNSQDRFSSKSMIATPDGHAGCLLTPALCAKVFVTGVFGSRSMNKEDLAMMPVATNVLQCLIEHAEEAELWSARLTAGQSAPPKWYDENAQDAQKRISSSSSSSSGSEDEED